MNEQLIDVIIAVYNGEKFIKEAITSVQQQSWENLSLIIVNDGSTDDTAALVLNMQKEDTRIVLLQQEHLGVSSALNKGIEGSTADYIAFLDADDLWHKDKLQKQMRFMNANAGDVCFCFLEEFETLEDIVGPAHRARPLPMKGISKTAMLIHKNAFKKYGYFNKDVHIGDFIEWYSRLVRDKKDILMLEEVLVYRRVHTNNTTHSVDKNSYVKLIKDHLDKMRKTKGPL